MSEERDSEALREWMYNFLIDHTGEDRYFFNMLSRSEPILNETLPLNVFEIDRAEMLKDIVSSLASLLGSEDAAGRWLMHSATFGKVVGSSPFDYISDGEFNGLCLLQDVLKVARAFPADPLGLSAEVTSKDLGNERDLECCLDIIQAAWDLDDGIFEEMLGVPLGYLQAWRHHEASVTEDLRKQIRRLILLHETLRLHVRPRGYAIWWRRPWTANSPIGARTPPHQTGTKTDADT